MGSLLLGQPQPVRCRSLLFIVLLAVAACGSTPTASRTSPSIQQTNSPSPTAPNSAQPASPTASSAPASPTATPTVVAGWKNFVDPVYSYFLRYPATWHQVASGSQELQYFTTSPYDAAGSLGPNGWWLTVSRVPYTTPSCVYIVPDPTATTQLPVASTTATMYYRKGPLPSSSGADFIDLGVTTAKTCYAFTLSYQGRMGSVEFSTANAIFTSFAFGPSD